MENDNLSEPDTLELMVAAAMGRQYRDDSRSFLKSLAHLLEQILPGEAQVQRSGWFGGDDRPVKRLEVSFRDPEAAQNSTRYFIEAEGSGEPIAGRTKVVRGIALKTETITTDDWVTDISTALARRSADSKAARDALRRLAE